MEIYNSLIFLLNTLCTGSWHSMGFPIGGKSFGFVSIDIECKNISISGDIGGFILSTK